MVKFHPYINAYKKDNASYTYWMDDGTRVTLVAEQDGVTAAWIEQLKAWHRAERSSMRRGEGLSVSLEGYCEALEDHSEALMDAQSNPEQLCVSVAEQRELSERLREALAALTPEQRCLLIAVHQQGTPLKDIADRDGCSYQAIQNRLRRIAKVLEKKFPGGGCVGADSPVEIGGEKNQRFPRR